MKKFLLSIFCLFCVMSYAVADEVTVTFSDLGYENAQEVTELTINEHLKATFSKGGNSSTTPKYYNTGKAYRLYAMNTMTITANNVITETAASKIVKNEQLDLFTDVDKMLKDEALNNAELEKEKNLQMKGGLSG